MVFNVIAVFDNKCEKMLMCKRRKNPYKGLFNFVGGKVNPGEDGLAAAYRELGEETGIQKDKILLTHLMDFTYHLSGIKVEVYVGKINEEVHIYGEENDLLWMDLNQNFFDSTRFAGEGNIGHIMEHIYLDRDIILK